MKKRFFQLVGVLVAGCIAFFAYDSYVGGYFSVPELPERAYLISFKTGLRAIVLDVEATDRSLESAPKFFRRLALANPNRKYLGVALEVQPWFEKAWSWCTKPTPDDIKSFSNMPLEFKARFEAAKFEAVCRVKSDGKEIIRGLIFSVEKQ